MMINNRYYVTTEINKEIINLLGLIKNKDTRIIKSKFLEHSKWITSSKLRNSLLNRIYEARHTKDLNGFLSLFDSMNDNQLQILFHWYDDSKNLVYNCKTSYDFLVFQLIKECVKIGLLFRLEDIKSDSLVSGNILGELDSFFNLDDKVFNAYCIDLCDICELTEDELKLLVNSTKSNQTLFVDKLLIKFSDRNKTFIDILSDIVIDLKKGINSFHPMVSVISLLKSRKILLPKSGVILKPELYNVDYIFIRNYIDTFNTSVIYVEYKLNSIVKKFKIDLKNENAFLGSSYDILILSIVMKYLECNITKDLNIPIFTFNTLEVFESDMCTDINYIVEQGTYECESFSEYDIFGAKVIQLKNGKASKKVNKVANDYCILIQDGYTIKKNSK